jgi:hypothetical protein
MGKIVWLASYPKSGNTWLRAFLHNLLRNPEEAYDINRIADFTLGDSDLRWYLGPIGRPPGDWTREEVGRVRASVHATMTGAFPDSVFVKTHNAMVADRTGPMITLAETAAAIYLVRNPLDVAVSFADHLGKSLDETIDFMADPGAESLNTERAVYQIYRSWSEHVLSWTERPHPGLHVLRYEDMLAEPTGTFRAVARFLGLDPPRPRLERAIRRSSFRVLQEQERRHGFAERSPLAAKFFREGKAGQWRRALTPEQADRVVASHRRQMERFGYLP